MTPLQPTRRDTRAQLQLLAHRAMIGIALFAVTHSRLCAAQQLRPVSFEFNVGVGAGHTAGAYGSGRGLSGDVLVALSPRVSSASGFVVAIDVAGQALGVASISCDAVPGYACDANFPNFGTLSALAGWETSNGAARVLAGPAIARSRETTVGAAQARVDLAKSIAKRLSLLLSVRAIYVPASYGDSFTLGSAGVGLRVR